MDGKCPRRSATHEAATASPTIDKKACNTTTNVMLLQMATEINETAKMEKLTKTTHQEEATERVPPGNTHQQGEIIQTTLRRTSQLPSQPGAYMGAPGVALLRATTLQFSLVGASCAHDQASTLEETPVLHTGMRQTIQQQQQQVLVPGAYSMAGPGNSNLTNNDTTTELPVIDHVMDPALFPNQARQSGTSMDQLAVANRVMDDPEDLMHADPVHLEEQEQREQATKKQRQTLLFSLFLVVCAVAAIVGTVAGTAGKKNSVVVYQTPSPIVLGSMAPSEIPSSAPTGVLDLLLDNLSNQTLARINSGSETPQWRVWNWLANHQNITWLPEWRKEQLFALATFFYAFEGEKWNPLIKERWMDDMVGECDWFSNGFGYFDFDGQYFDLDVPWRYSCNSHGNFTSLWLENLQLSGLTPSIPPEITMLSSLSLLQFSSNDIATSISSLIPAEVYEMTDLTSFGIFLEQVTGQFPSELGLLTALKQLYLMENELTGQIPSEIGELTDLFALPLWNNHFTGQVPSELGRHTNMYFLELSLNQFTGPLPSELGRLPGVSHFGCKDNQFTGPVPSEFGQLLGLTFFKFDGNQLTGPLPSELGLLTNLKALNLTGNLGLSGTIPEELCFLQNVSCSVYGDDHWFTQSCHIDFDCTSILCGCDCSCSNSSLM
ncbi:expressed unknown protein [Seminavis robusta]|uniref:L domain-like protein n=1 Tax=Seminavis robusta TaxID=568900 RepID=A0A9N8ELY4_9STRA|nr:expressed unknown protein [Seminavis robusta]|eukprot:Sro1150_g056891.1  (663) ;mRNA; f:826-2814